MLKHICCRNSVYPTSSLKRFPVPDELISWYQAFPEYTPSYYDSEILCGKEWADPPINTPGFKPMFNELDVKHYVNRKSFMGPYDIFENKYPLNPAGRTGLQGMGILGRWGPNHAADPVVTKWKRNSEGVVENDSESLKPVLQFCGIERHDCNQWAIPGGMVDPGENISATLKREFIEEALSLNDSSILVEEFFNTKGIEIFKGYIDDPRNTDNAWMESTAFNFHDDEGTVVGKLRLHAGDDARNVRWIDIDNSLKLYASHSKIIEKVAQRLGAHF